MKHSSSPTLPTKTGPLALGALALLVALATPASAQTTEDAKLIADIVGGTSSGLGRSMAISGDLALIGAPGDSDNGKGAGATYVFDLNTGQQLAKLLADDGEEWDQFGTSVALSGDMALIGAPLDTNDNGSDAGAAYVFDLTSGEITKLLASDGQFLDRFGTSVAISGDTALIGAQFDDDLGSQSGAAYVFDLTTGQQIAKLRALDGQGWAYFGQSVAISGDTAIIGAPEDDNDNGVGAGAAYVFDLTTGQQVAKLLALDGSGGFLHRFGYSVDISGDTALIGAYGDDDSSPDAGAVYVFDLTSGQEVFKLIAEDAESVDLFGWSVAISGDTALIGARRENDNGDEAGAAYVFDLNTGQQVAKLLADDGGAADNFGWSVAISGDTALIGANGDDDNGDNAGAAYVFSASKGEQSYKLLADDGEELDSFGESVAISGDTALIGAWGDDDNGVDAGAAYVFDRHSNEQLFKLFADDGEEGDRFGGSVAISGDTALIGATGDNDNGNDAGSVYVFDVTTGQQIAKLLAEDGEAYDYFGVSVAISGDTALIGAWGNDESGSNAGAAYVFDLSTGQEVEKLLAFDGVAADYFGYSVAISGDTALIGAPFEADFLDDTGASYVFDLTSGESTKLLADDGEHGDYFGWTVAISGDGETALIGASDNNNGNGDAAGAAYVFDVTTGQQVAKLLADDGEATAYFGRSVAISGDTALIGALGADSYAGAAYVFDVPTGQQVDKLLASDGEDYDLFGTAVAISGGTALIGARGDDDNASNAGAAYVYDLGPDCGVTYCGADQNPNNAATISIDTCVLDSASIQLTLAGGPAGEATYLLVGDGNATVSAPPGSDGDLCIVGGASLARYITAVGGIDAGGSYSTDIKAHSTGTPGSPDNVAFTVGSTWNFQYWHRRPSANSSFSQAIAVTFE